MKMKFTWLLVVCLFSVTVAASSLPMGTLRLSLGNVYLKKTQSENWKAVPVGALLFEGDRLRTLESGKAEILLQDGSVIFVGPESEMEFINEVNEKTPNEKQSIFLFFGSMWNKVVSGAEYEVETIHALAAVKGTYFNVSVDDAMEVWVKEGEVEISNQYGQVSARKNTYTKVSKDAQPLIEEIENNEFPTEVSVESSLYFDVTYPTNLYVNEWIKVVLFLRDKSGELASSNQESIQIVANDGVILSQDKNNQLTEITLPSIEEEVYFYIKGTSEFAQFTMTSSDVVTLTESIQFRPELTTKEVFIEFEAQDGSIRQARTIFKKSE